MFPMAFAAVAASLAAASPSPRDLEFKGARLGMTLAQWEALPDPAGAVAHTVIQCTPATGGASVCAYANRYGTVSLPQSFALDKTCSARRPTYDFVGGRLAAIDFHASVDAFDDVMAVLEGQYGPANQTLRNQTRDSFGGVLPRVQKIWRLPSGEIRLTDPSDRPDELSVRISGPAASSPAGPTTRKPA